MKFLALCLTMMIPTAYAAEPAYSIHDVESKDSIRIVVIKTSEQPSHYEVAHFNCKTHSMMLGEHGKDPSLLSKEIKLSDTEPVTEKSPYFKVMEQACN
jgi:hypothetical protein